MYNIIILKLYEVTQEIIFYEKRLKIKTRLGDPD